MDDYILDGITFWRGNQKPTKDGRRSVMILIDITVRGDRHIAHEGGVPINN